eukprot:TRINITY_DN7237_c0_g1_i1.p1 TRINITY_DN7237_c0_g1~~TRINITY_DN7237_c0_g1_i1.p1  ORF type:complete len:393 (+),score=179.32 TRINITY_DN7237_c0_g1_i1:93-1271(+)
MRGGPRLMCSPYLTGSLGIMLCLVTFNYWSVSTQNSDLVKKVEELQQQLQLGSKHIQSLEEETREVRRQMKTYKDRVAEEKELKKEVGMKFKDMNKDRDDLKQRLDAMIELKSEGEESERKLSEDREMQDKAMDTIRDELEEVKGKLLSVQTNLTSCQAELASDRAEKLLVPPQGAVIPPRHLGRGDSLGPGQLPDVNPVAVSVIKKETQGSGLTIVDNAVKMVDNVVNKMAVSPSPKVEVMNLSSSRKPVSSSQGGEVGVQQQGVVPAPKIVVNDAGVMPLPNVIKSGDAKAGGFENLDNAEDDSQIAQHENGPEGKKEILDDDQNPDGQIDETVDLDKQHYLVDKAQEESGGAGEGAGMLKTKEDVENSLENVEDNLDNLKESLNNNDNQ